MIRTIIFWIVCAAVVLWLVKGGHATEAGHFFHSCFVAAEDFIGALSG